MTSRKSMEDNRATLNSRFRRGVLIKKKKKKEKKKKKKKNVNGDTVSFPFIETSYVHPRLGSSDSPVI